MLPDSQKSPSKPLLNDNGVKRLSPRSLGSSALLHVMLILLVVFGLPSLFIDTEELYQPQVIAMDLKIAPVVNAPNRTPKPPKKPEQEKPKPKPPAPKPEPKPEPVKKPEPKPAPKKEEPKKEKPKKEEAKKEEPKKEEPKKEEPKKEAPKTKEPTLDDILDSLDAPEPPAPAEKGEKSISDVPYDPTAPLSQTVENSIRNQIMKCWNYQGGAKDQETLVAHIQVIFREDGSIIDAKLKATDQMRYSSDPAFRSMVDSARRATRNPDCVPLKGLPVNEYKSWSKVELVFDPAEMW